MTQREILTMATNFDIQWRMKEIESIMMNMCHKTKYEQRTARDKMKRYAKEIQAILKGKDIDVL